MWQHLAPWDYGSKSNKPQVSFTRPTTQIEETKIIVPQQIRYANSIGMGGAVYADRINQ